MAIQLILVKPICPLNKYYPKVGYSDKQSIWENSSRKLGGPAEHLIYGSENAFVGWAFNFRFRVLLKSAVK